VLDAEKKDEEKLKNKKTTRNITCYKMALR